MYDSYTDLDERGFRVELQRFAERVAFAHGASKISKVSTSAWPALAGSNKDQEMDASYLHRAACHTRVFLVLEVCHPYVCPMQQHPTGKRFSVHLPSLASLGTTCTLSDGS